MNSLIDEAKVQSKEDLIHCSTVSFQHCQTALSSHLLPADDLAAVTHKPHWHSTGHAPTLTLTACTSKQADISAARPAEE